MRQEPPNARFWDCLPSTGPVKITLNPGQELHHWSGGPADEGWSGEDVTWTHEGDRVVCRMMTDGVDCDGRLTRQATYECPLEELQSGGVMFDFPDLPMPQWSCVDKSQRDQFAEAAGY